MRLVDVDTRRTDSPSAQLSVRPARLVRKRHYRLLVSKAQFWPTWQFMRDGIWKWVKPVEWIDTNWADRNDDGVDDYPGSLLDFVFVANGATEWKTTRCVIVRDGDFPDDEAMSDHRPVELVVE